MLTMYTLLIVDDEPMERDGLQVMVKRQLPNVEVVGTAANGREAIEACDLHRPDMVTMDVKMPGIDGLQATREILKKHPAMKVMIFSAYDTFAYAQKAMKLGVKDYVLKPYTQEDVVKVVHRVIRMIEDEQAEQAEKLVMTEQYQTMLPLAETELWSQLVFHHVHEIPREELRRLLNIHEESSYVMLIRLWQEDQTLLPIEQQKRLYTRVKNTLKTMTPCLFGPMIDGHIPVAVFLRQKAGQSPRSQATILFRNVTRPFRREPMWRTLCYAAGVGRLEQQLTSLRHSYQEALSAVQYVERSGQILFYDDIERDDSVVTRRSMHLDPQIVSAARQDHDGATVRQEKQDFFSKAIQYLDEHFHESVSLETVAEYVGLSSFYFSKLFREEAGITFIDYLTRLRIKEAKRLLLETDHSLKRICFEVGYRDPNYFSRVFKKTIGMSPSDFRRKHTKKR